MILVWLEMAQCPKYQWIMDELTSVQIKCIFNEAILLCVNSNEICVFHGPASSAIDWAVRTEHHTAAIENPADCPRAAEICLLCAYRDSCGVCARISDQRKQSKLVLHNLVANRIAFIVICNNFRKDTWFVRPRSIAITLPEINKREPTFYEESNVSDGSYACVCVCGCRQCGCQVNMRTASIEALMLCGSLVPRHAVQFEDLLFILHGTW